MAKTTKRKEYYPTEKDMVNVHEVITNAKIAFSVEKCIGGYHLVRYNVDDNGVGLKNTISYKRIDVKEKDTPRNRVIYSTQNEAEEDMYRMYAEISNYYGLS